MRISLVFAALLLVNGSHAQEKIIEHREMLWLGYFNQLRVAERSGVWVDFHLRFNEFGKELHAVLPRVGYIYHFSDQARLSAGYAYQLQPGHHDNDDVLEHRPWQQIQWFEKKKYFNMMQWVRLEQRFRKTGESDLAFLSHRIRYNLSFTIPLSKKGIGPGNPFLFTNNEVFINMGKNIVNNYFDQNRFFAGFGYQFTAHMNVQLGYMYILQQLPSGNNYIHTDAIRFFVFHNLDFRNK